MYQILHKEATGLTCNTLSNLNQQQENGKTVQSIAKSQDMAGSHNITLTAIKFK
jgi:hypothetical protein